jgi:hypothetical protein
MISDFSAADMDSAFEYEVGDTKMLKERYAIVF